MRFMLLLMRRGDIGPPAEAQALAQYGVALRRAGILLAFDGLQRPAEGARVSFADGHARVVDGAPAGTHESVGGYWLIQAGSRDEAIEWATRCPAGPDAAIEVRQVLESTPS